MLAGFSQGGAIALQTGLRYPRKLARHHGALDLPAARRKLRRGSRAGQPQDADLHGARHAGPVVPYEMAARSRDVLVQHGYDVEWHEYPMPHSVCLEEIADIARMAARRVLK